MSDRDREKDCRRRRRLFRAVKGNYPTLHQGIEDYLHKHLESDFSDTPVRRHETREKGNGREENRYYFLCLLPDDLPDRERWPGLEAIGIAISDTIRDGKQCNEVCCYILSKDVAGRRFAAAVCDQLGSRTVCIGNSM